MICCWVCEVLELRCARQEYRKNLLLKGNLHHYICSNFVCAGNNVYENISLKSLTICLCCNRIIKIIFHQLCVCVYGKVNKFTSQIGTSAQWKWREFKTSHDQVMYRHHRTDVKMRIKCIVLAKVQKCGINVKEDECQILMKTLECVDVKIKLLRVSGTNETLVSV